MYFTYDDKLIKQLNLFQDLAVSHIQTKKELVEIDALVEESMADYGDERASVLRLNMAIVEERTCQWSLFQRALRDLVTIF